MKIESIGDFDQAALEAISRISDLMDCLREHFVFWDDYRETAIKFHKELADAMATLARVREARGDIHYSKSLD